jgi:hypothetical protein
MVKIIKLPLFWWFLLLLTSIFGYGPGSGTLELRIRFRIHNTYNVTHISPRLVPRSIPKLISSYQI